MAGIQQISKTLQAGDSVNLKNESGGILIINAGINGKTGVYSIPRMSNELASIIDAPGVDSYYTLEVKDGNITIINKHSNSIFFRVKLISL